MKNSKIFSSIALVLWMGASWFFYLGYSNNFIAGAMFFIPVIPALDFRGEAQPVKWNFKTTALTFCYVAIGVGIHDVLASFGGLSSFAHLVFGNELIMISTNAVFALHLLKGDVTDESFKEQPVA
jgi:hypothetical protein